MECLTRFNRGKKIKSVDRSYVNYVLVGSSFYSGSILDISLQKNEVFFCFVSNWHVAVNRLHYYNGSWHVAIYSQ